MLLYILTTQQQFKILNKQSCKDQYIMCLVRRFVLSCMLFNILTRCVQIEGRFNILPDLAFRFKVEEFHQLAPQMDRKPTPILNFLLQIER